MISKQKTTQTTNHKPLFVVCDYITNCVCDFETRPLYPPGLPSHHLTSLRWLVSRKKDPTNHKPKNKAYYGTLLSPRRKLPAVGVTNTVTVTLIF